MLADGWPKVENIRCPLCLLRAYLHWLGVQEHENEKNHIFAAERAKIDQEQWNLAQRNAILREKTGILNCLNMAYMLAKEDLSTLKFESLLLGTEAFYITDDLTATVNIGVEEYRNKDAAREFILCLGDVVRDSILEDVRLSPAYAIGVDESTDISTVEEMIMTSQRSSGTTRKKRHYRGNPISRKADKGCIVVSGMLDIIEDIVDSEDVEAETEALVDEAVAEEDDESAEESGCLNLDEYGPEKMWCILKKEPKKKQSIED
ncbi:hypothetical protein CYMTET_49112 [Cymbomonas tetramitiformis]|uniref:Uncharacterized protein n=1 Tax=Cymbomonas tetramitiformis TaxID=36881 RepID=A0AAE0BSJ2_9CHLO|nr:hypothetical protein CYMTET_49112 [Cymbomonas tetramitiformis]